jgi:hypothetical protein
MQIHPDSNSQANQESFVLNVTAYKIKGTYIEIGAYHSSERSNTYILETLYKWRGISFEIEQTRAEEFNLNRKNTCLIKDARFCNYRKILAAHDFPFQFDYLQIDIDPAINSFIALLNFPLRTYQPSIITFEHDKYRGFYNKPIQSFAYYYLRLLGYERIFKDVYPKGTNISCAFEDWYVKNQ